MSRPARYSCRTPSDPDCLTAVCLIPRPAHAPTPRRTRRPCLCCPTPSRARPRRSSTRARVAWRCSSPSPCSWSVGSWSTTRAREPDQRLRRDAGLHRHRGRPDHRDDPDRRHPRRDRCGAQAVRRHQVDPGLGRRRLPSWVSMRAAISTLQLAACSTSRVRWYFGEELQQLRRLITNAGTIRKTSSAGTTLMGSTNVSFVNVGGSFGITRPAFSTFIRSTIRVGRHD